MSTISDLMPFVRARNLQYGTACVVFSTFLLSIMICTVLSKIVPSKATGLYNTNSFNGL